MAAHSSSWLIWSKSKGRLLLSCEKDFQETLQIGVFYFKDTQERLQTWSETFSTCFSPAALSHPPAPGSSPLRPSQGGARPPASLWKLNSVWQQAARPASCLPGEGREWEYMLGSHQGCQAVDGQKHNPHAQGTYYWTVSPTLALWTHSAPLLHARPIFFSHSNFPSICGDYHASTHKPIELDQNSGGLHRAWLRPSQHLS